MSEIPKVINGVSIEFSPNANNDVDKKIINALRFVLSSDIVPDHVLTKIYISSAKDQHNFPSRHVQGEGKAIDISRINGLKMSTHYDVDDSVKAITNALQENFDAVSGHKDHIHFSIN